MAALKNAAAIPAIGGTPLQLTTDFVESVTSEAQRTLNSCDHLIQRNPYFKKDGRAIKNIVWAVSVKEDVEKLQTRVQICFHKVNFVLLRQHENNEQARIELFMANNQDSLDVIQSLLQQVAERVGVAVQPENSSLLGDAVRQRFAATQNSRRRLSTSTIPQKIDALLVFYERSTHKFSSQPPSMIMPPTIQYLNLLKCIYLLEDIKRDSEFRCFCQKPMSAAWLRFHANKVDSEARRFLTADGAIQQVPDDELLRQNDEEFVIDLQYLQEVDTLDPLSNNLGEELVMQTTLVPASNTSVEQLFVFRSSINRLRLTKTVSKSTHAHNATTQSYQQELNLQTVFIDPIYAMSPQAQPSIVWRSIRSDTLVHSLHFTTMGDLKDFQRAITNHIVVADQDTLVLGRKKCSFLDGSGKVFSGSGKIQLWSYKDPLNPVMQSPRSSQSPSTTQSEATFTSKALDGLTQTTVLRGSVNGNELIRPMPYQVVIMSTMSDKQQLVAIRIDQHTRVNPDKCRCSETNSRCQEVFIDHEKKKLHVTTATSRAANSSSAWNLAVFGRADHHSHHQDLKHAEEEYVKYVVLKFADVSSKEDFASKLARACHLMLRKHNDYTIAMNVISGMSTYSAE